MTIAIFPSTRLLSATQLANRRRTLVRLGLAWLAMMQVMMFALPSYVRHEVSVGDNIEVFEWALRLMNWASLVLTVPVVLYSAWPIWQGATAGIGKRRLTMDTPVAISILAAFIPSAWSTWAGHGEVYFDSITMFVAFLLTARYLEMGAEQSVSVAKVPLSLEAGKVFRSLSARADRVAVLFIGAQLTLAALATAVWWRIDPDMALPVMVALLVMSCPCALSLAAPCAFAVAQSVLVARGQASPNEVRHLLAVTSKVTRQNLYGSLVWHLLTVPLAATGVVTPWMAALAMLLSSLAVALNALRIGRLGRSIRDGDTPFFAGTNSPGRSLTTGERHRSEAEGVV